MASRMNTLHILIGITLLLACLQGGVGIEVTLNFVKEPEDVIAKRNQPVLLDCLATSSPDYGPVNLTWYHKGAIVRDEQKQILNNGSLYIRKVRFKKHPGGSSSAATGVGVNGGSGGSSFTGAATTNLNVEANGDDIGSYYCTISNKLGTLVSRQAHVYVASMAKKFTIEPEPAVVEEGDVVRFTCQIQAFPIPKYSWQKELNTSEDSDPWIRIPQVDSRITVLAGGVLQISGVLSSDAGNYRCVAQGVEHERASSKALLQVIPASLAPRAPTFLTKETTVVVKAGETAILECLVSGYPQTEISWSRAGDLPIKPEGVTYGLGNLVLSSVTLSDNGTYICTASSKEPEELESSSIAQMVHLNVQKLPEFIKKPKSVSEPLGRTVRLECEAQGVPKPTITWLKNGRAVNVRGRLNFKNNELIFSQTITADAGIYQCKAENSLGQRLISTRLQFITHPNQPNPPINLVATTRSNTSIELSWSPAPSPSHPQIRAYTIHYFFSSGGQENQVVVVNTNTVIEKLSPYTNYTFYIRAWTGHSPSEPSQSISQMTGEDIPLAAPSVVLTSNLTSMHITWDELPPKVARGVIVTYKIQWRKKNHDSYNVLEVSGNKRDYTVQGLRPGHEYDVRVLAATKVGYPILSDNKWPWVTHRMPNNISPHVPLPPTLLLTVVNFSTIKVVWKLPDDNEFEAKGFELRYSKQNQRASKSFTLPNNTTQFLITDLEPHSLYEVRVNGFNENGNGTESVGVIATPQESSQSDGNTPTHRSVIEPPSELEAIATSSRSIRLTWKMPLTNKNISYYMVRCNPVHNLSDFNTSVVRYFKSEKIDVNLTDLMPYTQYEFSVRSHDHEDKSGPYSNKVECKTLEDVPTAPQYLRLFIVDPHTIRLTWQPPRFPNGVIISYDVLYNTAQNSSLTYEQWSIIKEIGSESTSLVNGLDSNTMYYLCVRAQTRAGAGPPTETISLTIPNRFTNQSIPTTLTPGGDYQNFQESEVGIIVGVSIGVCCMIICALIIICRNRCFPSPAPLDHIGLHSQHWGNNYVHHHSNGNGHIPREYRISSSESHEMDSITPMLTSIPETTSPHLDTKGGYLPGMPYGNGFANNNRETQVPCGNGHTSQSLLINITSNPQFEMTNEAGYAGDKQITNSKKCHGSPSSSSAPLLDKSADSTSGLSEDNPGTPYAAQSTGNLVPLDKNRSRQTLSPDNNEKVESDSDQRQQQRRHSHQSSSHKTHHNHSNQSNKPTNRNSAPSNSGSNRNNATQIHTSISPFSSSTSASESLLPTSSSSSTVVIIPSVTSSGHHTNVRRNC